MTDVPRMGMRHGGYERTSDGLPELAPLETALSRLPPDKIGLHPVQYEVSIPRRCDARSTHCYDAGVTKLGQRLGLSPERFLEKLALLDRCGQDLDRHHGAVSQGYGLVDPRRASGRGRAVKYRVTIDDRLGRDRNVFSYAAAVHQYSPPWRSRLRRALGSGNASYVVKPVKSATIRASRQDPSSARSIAIIASRAGIAACVSSASAAVACWYPIRWTLSAPRSRRLAAPRSRRPPRAPRGRFAARQHRHDPEPLLRVAGRRCSYGIGSRSSRRCLPTVGTGHVTRAPTVTAAPPMSVAAPRYRWQHPAPAPRWAMQR